MLYHRTLKTPIPAGAGGIGRRFCGCARRSDGKERHMTFALRWFAFVSCAAMFLGGRDAVLARDTVPLPPCPSVVAGLGATIDTKKVKPGEIFRFSTLDPVRVGDTLIPPGTNGVGLIETSDHSKSQGHSGYLVLEARYVELADGTHVPVAFRPGDDGHSQAFVRAGSSSAGILGYLPYYIGTAAGVYDAFHHGKDAALVAGARLPLIVGDGLYSGTCGVTVDPR